MGALITQHCPPSNGQRKLRKESYKGWRGLLYSYWMKEGQEPSRWGCLPQTVALSCPRKRGIKEPKPCVWFLFLLKT